MITVKRERIFNCNNHFVCYDSFCPFEHQNYQDLWYAENVVNKTTHGFVFGKNPLQAKRRLLAWLKNPKIDPYTIN